MEVTDIPLSKVSQFSSRDQAYYTNTASFKDFIAYDFDFETFPEIIKSKSRQEIDRPLLQEVIGDQYAKTNSSVKTKNNIEALSQENCFTVVTAHQPSLLTGPLYYIYKILSAVNLSEKLNKSYNDYRFVPCFILGSEDHDFEEINHLNLYGKTLKWETTAGGSVGALSSDGLAKVLDDVKTVLGDSSKAKGILDQLIQELPDFATYDQFAFRLTHILFDHLGLVIIRMSDRRLKSAFSSIIKKEITERPSKGLVVESQEKIKASLGFEAQAYAREINFFYSQQNRRDRIDFENGKYKILDTGLTFTEDEMIKEIDEHPERFSPNVITRPLYQEFTLPNLAYIGGGGELAYWTERKTQFEHFKIPFPILIRRRSGLILTPSSKKQLDKLRISVIDSFQGEQSLISKLITDSAHPDYQLQDLKANIEELYELINQRIAPIDKTLVNTAGSEKAKALKSLDYLESKLKKAIKQKEEVNLNRLTKLKSNLFPSGLQERHDNIFQFISIYGPEIIDSIYDHCDPFDKTFKVFMMPAPAG